jgi:hypothetical protein
MFDFSDAVGSYAQGEAGARGAIFTRREVVEFILDLAGYMVDRSLHCLFVITAYELEGKPLTAYRRRRRRRGER